jgi:nitrogen regulatory protein PII
MKSTLIVHNQALTEKVEYMLDSLKIRGFTKWEDVVGRGSEDGKPHMGTHTWPEQNSAVLVIADEDKTKKLLESVKKIDAINEEVGIRAFVWQVEQMV